MPPDVILALDAVTKDFAGRRASPFGWRRAAPRAHRAVDAVSFEIRRGETFGLVGESGCGKSTIARMITGLTRPSAGVVRYEGVDIAGGRRAGAKRPQMIFQDPLSSLDPRWRVRDIIAEPIRVSRPRAGRAAIDARVHEVLSLVGMTAADAARFPHEFSGGQRQRIAIARALASEADFIVCDEPTSALDVSIQAQVLNVLADLRDRLGLTYLFITHNIPVMNFIADRVGVLYRGRMVERGDAADVLTRPRHPYTRALIAASLDPLASLEATETDAPHAMSRGCDFRAQCPRASAICAREAPAPAPSGGSVVACHHAEPIAIERAIAPATDNDSKTQSTGDAHGQATGTDEARRLLSSDG